jgi:hypothetical protein
MSNIIFERASLFFPMNQQNRFQSGLSTVSSILTTIPAGTALIVTVSTIFFVLNLFTSWNVTGGSCVASTHVTNGIPWKCLLD